MEGWDGTSDGKPSELTSRRWRRFGESGAKLIWGGEAVAVCTEGRANPNQLVFRNENKSDLASLRTVLVEEHARNFGDTADLFVGLQLTHSGRFCRPTDKKKLEPKILYHHPILDRRFGIPPDYPCLSDSEISRLIDDFIRCAGHAYDVGFQFVDIKHCHGYLGHEFLSAVDRDGMFGGSFEHRTRFLREIVAGIRARAPALDIAVRLSAFDIVPFAGGKDGTGVPEAFSTPYRYAFGADPADPLHLKLDEAIAFLKLLQELKIRWVCITAGSPYYNPHIQRPALFPPSDGYHPPEDPLAGVARHIDVTRRLKQVFPDLVFVGSGYSYLQEWIPHVAQHNVRKGYTDFVGLGRLILSYPRLAADVLAGRPLQTKSLCRTFSDCTTGPRNGLVSGCFPLDPFYKNHPDGEILRKIKSAKLASI
jgi:2,4-dienoyl-CoA reductase-like NADH-dependent reductase (Old Yellow Enzyme family)